MPKATVNYISIRALRGEGDLKDRGDNVVGMTFQSAPSAGRATCKPQ